MIDGAWTMELAGERPSDRIDLEGPSTRAVRIVLEGLSEAHSGQGTVWNSWSYVTVKWSVQPFDASS